MAVTVGISAQGSVINGTPCTVTGGNSHAAGSTFVIFILSSGALPAISSISDVAGGTSTGNTYTLRQTQTLGTTFRLDEYLCVNGVGGTTHTWTVNFAANAYATVFAIEVVGGKTSGISDADNGATSSTTTPTASITITPGGVSELILTAAVTDYYNAAITFSDTGSAATTSVIAQTNGTAITPSGYVGSASETTAGTYTSTVGDGGGTQHRIVIMDSFLGITGQTAVSSVGSATGKPAGSSTASGSFVTSGVANVTPVTAQFSIAAAFARGTAHQGLVQTTVGVAGTAAVFGMGNQYLNIAAAAAYSVGSAHTHAGIAPAAISSVFAGATVTGSGYGFTLGQSAAGAAGVATVAATGNQAPAGGAASAIGAASVIANTPDQNVMGVGAETDASAIQASAFAVVTGAIVNAGSGSAAFSAGTTAVTGVTFAGELQSVAYVPDAVGKATGVAGTIVAASAFSHGAAVARPTPIKPPLRSIKRDGRIIVKANQERLSARDEEEILSIMPHIMDHIARFEAQRLQ